MEYCIELLSVRRGLFRVIAEVIVVAMSGVACSSSSAGLTGETGFTPNTQLAGYYTPLNDGGPDPSVIVVTLARVDQGPLTCSELLPSGHPAVTTGDAVEIFMTTGDGSSVAAGSYDFVVFPGPPMGTRGALLLRIDLDGGATIGAGASGSVALTSATGGFAGSFNTTIENVDGGSLGALSGSFSAPNCGPLYEF
jgi:hypothetical protein